jgi:hypothetical protein
MTSTRALAYSTLVLLSLAACGGETAGGSSGNPGNGPGSGSGNGPGSGSAGGSCTLSAGTYTEHLVAEPGGTNCPPIADQTITLGSDETFTGGGSSGSVGGGQGCTSNVDPSTCTATTSCTTTANGYTDSFTDTIRLGGSSASGTEKIEMTDSGGNVLSSCVYDITLTKQ